MFPLNNFYTLKFTHEVFLFTTRMAYTPVNKLYRAYEVQQEYKKYANTGRTDVYIYRTYIKDKYLISLRTFYNYLAIPAAAELKKLGLPIQLAQTT